ncbi:MAG: LLM class flavin-dependent oxidoreductase [Actinomycetota bacterium]|nr:LLM class flavin-dependent oxidoreductase [Actinomycetota bacterium]MDH5224612.1 LLM class flavin-dependent oxidoreductase [Actinomycetota bacterium]MDH5314148.1 LLM class flavin-dependent oxidoreductase [Actinomycetota bacterium]
MTLRSGVVLQGVYPPDEFRSMVSRIDALGFSNLWLTDSSLHARNSYAYLTLASTVSPRLLLGTAVTNPLTRHPAITAVAAATVDDISDGRMILGIGAGDRPLLALGLRPARLASMRSAVDAIRSLWSGADVTVEDPAFELHGAHLRFGARSDIPVYISASGPRTLQLAGEIADGVIVLVGLFSEGLAWALDHVDRGAAIAGRPRPHVAVFAYGAIDDDEEKALGSARSIAAWFPQTAPVICELAGLPSAVLESVRERYEGGEFQEADGAAQLLPDDFVRQVALAGDERQALERIDAVAAAGADSIHVFPLGEDRMQTVERFSRCFAKRAQGVGR